MRELNYVLNNKELSISLNLYEAERYENAVLIQPLIGNLVTYSNKGRYTPLVAKNWSINDQGDWTFEINKGFKCANNEEITAPAFKHSLELSVKYLALRENLPIFSKLVGFQEFVDGKSPTLKGIEASNDQLIFRFTEPTRSGVIQTLSFAPFGYICSANRNSDGSWKNDREFVSSGPYKVISHTPGKSHTLELRSNWHLHNINAPKRIHFYFSLDSIENGKLPTIVDSFTKVENLPENLTKYKLVPEFINTIILSPYAPGGYFASKENRIAFKKALEAEKAKLPLEIENHTKSDFYYPNQPPKHVELVASEFKKPNYPLKIQGKIPPKGSKWYLNWSVIEGALKALEIPYEIDDTAKTYSEKVSNRADIRYIGSAIGGGAQAWGVSFQFCSEIGPRFPDPSGEICKAVTDFEKGFISEEQFSDAFNQRVFDDASVIPLTHYGIIFYISPEINRDSISPMVSVLRFDQLELE